MKVVFDEFALYPRQVPRVCSKRVAVLRESCGGTLASVCMKGRQKSGIQVACVLSSAMCWNGLPKLQIRKHVAILVHALALAAHCFCVCRVKLVSPFGLRCFFVSRFVMPRRGWQQFDVPSGWVRVLRGLRPPSERWPVVHHPSSVGRGRLWPTEFGQR